MPRPRSFDTDEALTTAMRVFWANGYDGTSLADLMEAMKLHKGSIYQAFGDKHQLYMAALSRYIQTGMAAMQTEIERASSPYEAVRTFLHLSIRQCVLDERARGCFMMNSAVELSSQDEEVRQLIAGVMQHVRGLMTDLIGQGQRAGDFRNDMEAEAMADLLMSVKAGVLTSGKVHLPGSDPFRALDTALASLLRT
ncbi:MAG: TetR/AcrR family transcriptional repressor of nem operon [Rhodothermales bacterium]|jgi:TetR/AcrR family transcriptional repressor of nem operon